MDRTVSAGPVSQYRAAARPRAAAKLGRLGRFGLLAVLGLLAAGCAVNETRSGLPPGAQTAIDDLTADIAASRDEQVYAAAADVWRQAATPAQSHADFERVRTTFGRVLSRALVSGREEQHAPGPLAGHVVTARFNTRFERGDALETFTLVERDGRWLLARYAIHSHALQ